MSRWRLIFILFVGMVVSQPAGAQILHADWVDAGQKAIEQQRRCAVRVLVLDATGKPVPSAAVHLTLRHAAFPLGAPATSMAQAPSASATQPAQTLPLWRCLNAVALDRLTDWAQLQPQAATSVNFDRVEAVIAAAPHAQFLRWGPVFRGDPGRLPNWLATLRGAALRQCLDDHLDLAFETAAGRVAQFDIDCDSLDHRFIDDHLGLDGLRTLFERARLAAPHAILCVRCDDALDGERLQLMIRRVITLREAFINVDMIAVSGRFGATVVQLQLARGLKWLHDLDVPVCVVNLELGGPSPEAAAINAETVLRTLYAEPVIKGIWFSGLRAEEVGDANAALVAHDGQPTPVGELVDKLFHTLWGFDATLPADTMGDLHCRVPPGVYEASAPLPGGTTASGTFLLTGAEKERLIVLQGTGK